MSRRNISLSISFAGTSPAAILRASPSAMAVLPTPGSPIRQGLFLVLAGENLNDPVKLSVPSDYAVKLAASRLSGKVGAIKIKVFSLFWFFFLSFFLSVSLFGDLLFLLAFGICVSAEELIHHTRKVAAPLSSKPSSPSESIFGVYSEHIHHFLGHRIQVLVGNVHFVKHIGYGGRC